jgi:hypothetical protein
MQAEVDTIVFQQMADEQSQTSSVHDEGEDGEPEGMEPPPGKPTRAGLQP